MLVAGAIVGVLAGAAALSLYLWMTSASEPLRFAPGYLPCRVLGRVPDPMVCLQLARTAERTDQLFRAWLPQAALVDRLLRVDFAFIIAYATFGCLASLGVGLWLASLGLEAALADGSAFATIALLAGALDAGENTALLMQMRKIPTTPLALGAFLAAISKFVLIALVGLWLTTGTVVATFATLAEILGASA